MPVDNFFVSLAENHKTAIGIILSGAASDGTLGLKAYKNRRADSLLRRTKPHNSKACQNQAIAEGVADMVLSPTGIAKELERLAKQAIPMFNEVLNAESTISDADEGPWQHYSTAEKIYRS
jgi:two-component system CheB/CheR fusion protein